MPAAGNIEVWTIDLDRPLNPAVNLNEILTAEERTRAERFLVSRDASRFRVCRAMLRLGLAWYLETTPQMIALTINAYGKPYLSEHSALNFNVSHSGGLGAIAFTTVGEVGIDVEAIERNAEALDIATSNFTGNEAAMVAAAATLQEQIRIFLRLWTRKEAVLKAAGCGLLGGLEGFDVSQSLDQVRLNCSIGGGGGSSWRIQDLEPMDGFAGALAAPAGEWSVHQCSIDCNEEMRGFAEKFRGIR
jgi:4'-phosphopantetheinyl transferase